MNPEFDIDCDEVARLISDGLDQTLSPRERTKLHLHFALCQACRNVSDQFQFLRVAMGRLGKDVEPTQDD